MKRFGEYADEAARFASPYIKRTGEFFSDAGDSAREWYNEKKRAYERRHNPSLWDRLCDAVNGSMRLILAIIGLISAIAAGIVIARAVIKKLYCSNHKIVSYDSSAAEEQKAAEKDAVQFVAEDDAEDGEPEDEYVSEPDEASDEIKKEKGYIVL